MARGYKECCGHARDSVEGIFYDPSIRAVVRAIYIKRSTDRVASYASVQLKNRRLVSMWRQLVCCLLLTLVACVPPAKEVFSIDIKSPPSPAQLGFERQGKGTYPDWESNVPRQLEIVLPDRRKLDFKADFQLYSGTESGDLLEVLEFHTKRADSLEAVAEIDRLAQSLLVEQQKIDGLKRRIAIAPTEKHILNFTVRPDIRVSMIYYPDRYQCGYTGVALQISWSDQ